MGVFVLQILVLCPNHSVPQKKKSKMKKINKYPMRAVSAERLSSSALDSSSVFEAALPELRRRWRAFCVC